MIFHNPTQSTLRFQLAGLAWSVPPGGECDIPPNVAYAVKTRGLPLAEGSIGGERAEAVVPDPPKVRPMPPPEPEPEDAVEDEAPAVTEAVEKLKDHGFTPKGRRGR